MRILETKMVQKTPNLMMKKQETNLKVRNFVSIIMFLSMKFEIENALPFSFSEQKWLFTF